MRRLLLPLVLAACCAAAAAQPAAKEDGRRRIALVGSMGNQALLSIDGGAPRVVVVGSTLNGVKLLSMNGAEAVVDVDGQRETLHLGARAVHAGGAPSPGSGSTVVLSGDVNGHFVANGQINGRSVSFLVDTGATIVAMGRDEAERIGLKYQDGQRVQLQTANGLAIGHVVTLNAVRLGDVEVYNVAAVVQPQPMPFVLLGNSFLTRFQMRRDNDTLTLVKRY
jgi:aspartyl protease family protein